MAPEFRLETKQQNRIERKDILPHLHSYPRTEVQGLNHLEEGKDWIVIPPEFYEVTQAMCEAMKESRGVFLVPKGEASSKGRFGVVAILTLGSYDENRQATNDPQKLAAINKMLADHGEEVVPIDFHTHTVAASPTAYNNFSEADMAFFEKNLNKSDKYVHVVLTPEKFMTVGMNDPQVAVGEFQNKDPLAEQERWQKIFNEYLERV